MAIATCVHEYYIDDDDTIMHNKYYHSQDLGSSSSQVKLIKVDVD
jgi:hypothetical protein